MLDVVWLQRASPYGTGGMVHMECIEIHIERERDRQREERKICVRDEKNEIG